MLRHPGHLSQGVQESIIVLTCNDRIVTTLVNSITEMGFDFYIYFEEKQMQTKLSSLTWGNMGAESMTGQVNAKQPE